MTLFTQLGRMALGCDDGRVIIHTLKKGVPTKLSLKKESVDDVQWDPNSPNYLLVSWKDGSMILLDAETNKEMQSFDRQGTGIVNLILKKKNVKQNMFSTKVFLVLHGSNLFPVDLLPVMKGLQLSESGMFLIGCLQISEITINSHFSISKVSYWNVESRSDGLDELNKLKWYKLWQGWTFCCL